MRQNKENVSPASNAGRNLYVVGQITDALIRLLADKELRDISISALCGAAQVGRASFYRNFESKEDVLRRHIRQLFGEWLGEAQKKGGRPLSDLLGLLFAHFERHMDFYSLLSERGLIYLLKDMFIELCGPRPEHEKAEAYARAYAAYALYGWVEVWFQRGMRETAAEIAELLRSQGL